MLQDATCVIWNYNGEVLQKFKGHKVCDLTCFEGLGVLMAGSEFKQIFTSVMQALLSLKKLTLNSPSMG